MNSIHSLNLTLFRQLSIPLAAVDDMGYRKGGQGVKKKSEMDPKDCSVSEDVWKLVDRLSENIVWGLTKLIQPHTKVLAKAVRPTKAGKVPYEKQCANKTAMKELLIILGAISTLSMNKSFGQAIVKDQQTMDMNAGSDSLLYCILHAYSLMCNLQQQEVVFRTMARLCQSSHDGMLSAFVHLSLVLDGDRKICDHGAMTGGLAEILDTMCSDVYKGLRIEDVCGLFKAPVAVDTGGDEATVNSAAAAAPSSTPAAAVAANLKGAPAASMKLKEQLVILEDSYCQRGDINGRDD